MNTSPKWFGLTLLIVLPCGAGLALFQRGSNNTPAETMNQPSPSSAEAKFWTWFISNKQRLEAVRGSDAEVIDELSRRIKSVSKGLVFELSAHGKSPREFIVSGDGLKELIPVVNKLASAAPEIAGWEVIAFRPRMEDYCENNLRYDGEEFDPSTIWFHPRTEEGAFDAIFYHPDYTDEDRNKFIAGTYILLDMALGELDVMTKVRYIDHQKLPKKPEAEGLMPYSKLREVFDTFHVSSPGTKASHK